MENRRLIAYVPLYPQNPLQPSYSAKGKADEGQAYLRICDKINNHIFQKYRKASERPHCSSDASLHSSLYVTLSYASKHCGIPSSSTRGGRRVVTLMMILLSPQEQVSQERAQFMSLRRKKQSTNADNGVDVQRKGPPPGPIPRG